MVPKLMVKRRKNCSSYFLASLCFFCRYFAWMKLKIPIVPLADASKSVQMSHRLNGTTLSTGGLSKLDMVELHTGRVPHYKLSPLGWLLMSGPGVKQWCKQKKKRSDDTFPFPLNYHKKEKEAKEYCLKKAITRR